jgi:seryl-tRNA synthetase
MSKSADKIQKLLDRENVEAKRLLDLSSQDGKDRKECLKAYARVQERIMVLEEAVKVTKNDDEEIMTSLLNLTCWKTKNPVKVGEVVKLFGWGMTSSLLGYGKFTWDEQHKKFDIEFVDDINNEMGVHDISSIADDEMYKVGVEKLSKSEKKKLEHYL